MRSIRSTNNRVRRKAGLVPRRRFKGKGVIIVSANSVPYKNDEITQAVMGRMKSIPFVLADEERATAGIR